LRWWIRMVFDIRVFDDFEGGVDFEN